MSGPAGGGFHAPDQNQCQSRSIQGLERLWYWNAESYGSGGYGSGRNHGSVFPWRYYRIPEKTDFGMSGDDWNCTGIRFCDTLSERPGNTHGKRFYWCCTSACRGWCGFCYSALRHYQKNHRSDQKPQAEDEHCIPWRFFSICVDDNDRGRKSVLWILWWNSWHLPGIWCDNLTGRCLSSGMSCRCFGCLSDWGTCPSGRTDKTCLGKGCPGYGGRAGTYADGSDCCKYEDPADHLHGCTVLCIRTSGDRYCAGIWSYHFCHRWCDRCCQRCGIPLLCDTSWASGTSECGRCKAGNYGIKDCSARGRYRKACTGSHGDGQ